MEKRKVELITISGRNGMTDTKEEYLAEPLFPDR